MIDTSWPDVLEMVQYYLAPFAFYIAAVLLISVGGMVWFWLRRGSTG